MKKGCTILCTALGGAIVGSAITLMLAPKTGKEMREMAHAKIQEQLKAINEHIQKCKCMMDGSCEMGEMDGTK